MFKLAIYGKGGIGKSTTVSNLAVALAERGLKVMQIGCDPKADSTLALRGGIELPSVLSLVRRRGEALSLEEMVAVGHAGVYCVEAGGPLPGSGCAGRGIVAALECLERKGAFSALGIDVVLYDVLGDVVCGGFAMPMRKGISDAVAVVTSGEKMSVYAAANIAMAVQGFQKRGYARLAGFILNRRGVEDEAGTVERLAADFGSSVLGDLPWSGLVQKAERMEKCVLEAFPDSPMAELYRALAKALLAGAVLHGQDSCKKDVEKLS